MFDFRLDDPGSRYGRLDRSMSALKGLNRVSAALAAVCLYPVSESQKRSEGPSLCQFGSLYLIFYRFVGLPRIKRGTS